MKINAILSFFVIFIILSSSCEENKIGCNREDVDNDWKKMNLNGKVKKIEMEMFKPITKFGLIEAGEKIVQGSLGEHESVEFNEFGKIMKKKLFGHDGEYVYFYNSQQLERVEYLFLYKAVKKYVYDSEGKVSEVNEYCNEENCMGIGGMGDLLGKERLKYNDIKKVVRSDYYSGSGNLFLRIDYTYDIYQGFPIYVKHTNVVNFNGKEEISETNELSISYNKDNDKIREFVVSTSALLGKSERDYTYQYLYDEKKNWIKKVTYKDDKPETLSVRKIVYYN